MLVFIQAKPKTVQTLSHLQPSFFFFLLVHVERNAISWGNDPPHPQTDFWPLITWCVSWLSKRKLKQRYPAVISLLQLPVFDVRYIGWKCQLPGCWRRDSAVAPLWFLQLLIDTMSSVPEDQQRKTTWPQMIMTPSGWSRTNKWQWWVLLLFFCVFHLFLGIFDYLKSFTTK